MSVVRTAAPGIAAGAALATAAGETGAEGYERARSIRSSTLPGAMREVFRIMMRAQAAAHVYTELRHRSDVDLAKRGLSRSDLPRAAYDALTTES